MSHTLAILLCLPAFAAAQQPPPIQDNSFLIEEAYNQEAGVVQHISLFSRSADGAWLYTFTQEWPFLTPRHQLSYTVPVQRVTGAGDRHTGFGDLALNYRYQLVGGGGAGRLAVAPRLSLLLPTGNPVRGTGAGGVGVQFNLPVSYVLGPGLVTHWNAGTTLVPSAEGAGGGRAVATSVGLAGSVVWLLAPRVNLLLETAWSRSDVVVGPGETAAGEGWVLSPGIRWAHDLPGGLQVVPGVAVPIGIGPSRGDRGLLVYLSFEHPFQRKDDDSGR